MPTTEKKPTKACCLVSELLEEAGIDRERVRSARRQILEGIVLLCQWQLRRMDASAPARSAPRRARKVTVD